MSINYKLDRFKLPKGVKEDRLDLKAMELEIPKIIQREFFCCALSTFVLGRFKPTKKLKTGKVILIEAIYIPYIYNIFCNAFNFAI